MNKNILRNLAAFVAIGAAVGCVDHRPVRNGLMNESSYLTKTDLTQDRWLSNVTVVESSSPNPMSQYLFPGLTRFLSPEYLSFRFVEDKLQAIAVRQLSVDDPNSSEDDLADTADRVIFEIPGRHVDVKLRESLDGERTNFLEENTEADWQARQFFKAEFEGISRDPSAMLAWYYAQFVQDCAAINSINLVPGSLEWSNDGNHFMFDLQVNYSIRLLTYFGGCYGLAESLFDVGEATQVFRMSFLKREENPNFTPVIIAEKDEVNKKYGSMQMLNVYRDTETGLLGGDALMNHWDPNRTEPVVYYFTKGYPEWLKPMWDEIITETNRVMTEAGAALRFEVADYDDPTGADLDIDGNPLPRKLGDMRYSFLAWHQDPDTTSGLLGYGPSVGDPETGENLTAVVNLYNVGYDWYRFSIEDFLESNGAGAKPDPNLAWEEIACAADDTLTLPDVTVRTSSTLFGEMRRVMEIEDSTLTPGVDPTDDFVPTPQREEFMDDFHRIMPEYRYAVSWWNMYAGNSADFMPAQEYASRMEMNREFTTAMDAITDGQNPFGVVALHTREGIEAQNEFIEKFRAWKENFQMLKMLREHTYAKANVMFLDEVDALAAVQQGARQCVNGFWESDAAFTQRIIETIVTDVAYHEFGHTLSLRHNFYGSNDAKHFRPANAEYGSEVTSSLMDYVRVQHNVGHHRKWGLYDEAALKWIYGTETVREAQMQEDFLYCTDEHRFFSPLCHAFDLGVTPSQIALNAIENYDYNYKFRNRRAYRKFWDTSSYVWSAYYGVFPLQRMWYLSIFDWGGGGVQDVMKRLDQTDPDRELLSDPEYDEIAEDFYNDAIAANATISAFYDAVINQPSSFRNYQSEYDPYYGDVLRVGIILDKLFTTFAFMDLTPVWDYDPNIYTYVAMYDASFGTRNFTLNQRVLDGMLGSNYDTFAWFKYFALNMFGYVTNSNLVGDTSLRDRIAIQRYENLVEFELAYPDAMDQIERVDNPQQFFVHNAEEYIYTFVEDRAWHLVAKKSRSPVSFQYIKDYNEALYSSASEGTDNFGLKILLAYYEYYNNFQGF